MNLNKVLLFGRLTADPQLRSTTTGQAVATFSIATNRTWNDKQGQKQESTEFHNIVVWGRQAEVASKFLTKGGLVFIEGRLQTRAWDDKQGVKHKVTEIVTERLQLGPRSGGGGSRPAPDREAISQESKSDIPVISVDEEINTEDLPF
ncbi:MAG: single-stranded DNA-binding protein [Patescibacteria group bacterium]